MTLEKELELSGIEMEGDMFRDLLVDMLHGMYRNWTDEGLMQNPDEAKRYCNALRERLSTPHIPDNFFLRWLTNTRKNGWDSAAREVV
jgi:hypothetical protein